MFLKFLIFLFYRNKSDVNCWQHVFLYTRIYIWYIVRKILQFNISKQKLYIPQSLSFTNNAICICMLCKWRIIRIRYIFINWFYTTNLPFMRNSDILLFYCIQHLIKTVYLSVICQHILLHLFLVFKLILLSLQRDSLPFLSTFNLTPPPKCPLSKNPLFFIACDLRKQTQ